MPDSDETAETFAGVFLRAGLDEVKARQKADALERTLATLLGSARPGEPESVARAIETLRTGALIADLEHSIDQEPPALNPGAEHDWIRSPEGIERACAAMASRARLTPGLLRAPAYMHYVFDGVRPRPHRAVPGDRNDPALYVDQLLLYVGEHLHLCQRLKSYAGLSGGTAAVSLWAQQSVAVDREADIYAWLREQWGTAVPQRFRDRYPSRAAVPEISEAR